MPSKLNGSPPSTSVIVAAPTSAEREAVVRPLDATGILEAETPGRLVQLLEKAAPAVVVLAGAWLDIQVGRALVDWKLRTPAPTALLVLVDRDRAWDALPIDWVTLDARFLPRSLVHQSGACLIARILGAVAPPGCRDDTYIPLVGASPSMLALRREIAIANHGLAPVLIEGPTGSGKEVVAQTLHRNGPRRDRPLVTVNVATVPPNLVASALFGHERGAFTGAAQRHRGLFVQAHLGTLFLDEIGELPLPLQAVLLRVLEDGMVTPVGGELPRRVDVRVIAATNRVTGDLVSQGALRADLFFRLRGFHLVVRLESHPWPGNVRELVGVLERMTAAAMVEGTRTLCRHHVRDTLGGSGPAENLTPLRLTLRRVEAEAVEAALAKTGGNVRQAARLLGEKPTTLHSRLRRLTPHSRPPLPRHEHAWAEAEINGLV